MSYFVWDGMQVMSVTLVPSLLADMPNHLKDIFCREGVSFTVEEWGGMRREAPSRKYIRRFERIIVFVDGEPEELMGTSGYRDSTKSLTIVLKVERSRSA